MELPQPEQPSEPSEEQKVYLVNYLKTHRELLSSREDSLFTNDNRLSSWADFAAVLNSFGTCVKPADEWRQYWFDLIQKADVSLEKADPMVTAEQFRKAKERKETKSYENSSWAVEYYKSLENGNGTSKGKNSGQEQNHQKLHLQNLGLEHKKPKVIPASAEQRDLLIEFVRRDHGVLLPRASTKINVERKNEAWDKVAAMLNSIQGAVKDRSQWQKYWRDIVVRTKNILKKGNVELSSFQEAVLEIVNIISQSHSGETLEPDIMVTDQMDEDNDILPDDDRSSPMRMFLEPEISLAFDGPVDQEKSPEKSRLIELQEKHAEIEEKRSRNLERLLAQNKYDYSDGEELTIKRKRLELKLRATEAKEECAILLEELVHTMERKSKLIHEILSKVVAVTTGNADTKQKLPE